MPLDAASASRSAGSRRALSGARTSARGARPRGDGRIYQRGAIFWVEYWHNGHQVRESSKGFIYKADGTKSDGRDRRAAERLLQERRRTAGTPQFIGPKAERVTFADLAALYLTD